MQLKAKRARSSYKSEGTYLRAVFKNNSKKISQNMADIWIRKGIQRRDNLSDMEAQAITEEQIQAARKDKSLVYKQFKGLIEERMKYKNPKTDENYSMSEALRVEARSKDLNRTWSTGDVYSRNFHNLILNAKDVKKKFYEHEGIKKVDYSKYNFLGYYYYQGKECAVYNYGDSYFLEAKSPQRGSGASVYYMTGEQLDYNMNTNTVVFAQHRKG